MRYAISIFLITTLLLVGTAPAADESTARNAPLDQAIDKALVFLQNNQRDDGSWMSQGRSSPAITALSVMAFMAAGQVPGEGRYGATIEKGIRWVLKNQTETGLIGIPGGHEMYHHGICTLMLAEVAGMTQGDLAKEVRSKLVKAVKLTLKAQRVNGVHKGGWHYWAHQTESSDMSLTGWQILSLRAAKNVGCDVPSEAIDRAVAYVKNAYVPDRFNQAGAGFRYSPDRSAPNTPCTGTGILALEVCGKDLHRSEPALRGGAYILRNPPRWGQSEFFFYGIYYCSQASFQLGENYWKAFREHMHEVLLSRQESNGSWVNNRADGAYGAAYSTSMCVLALAVEYRYLPIYQRGEEPTDPDK